MSPTIVRTLNERKWTETARRRRVADQVIAELRQYAQANQGHFVIFGSFATNTMHFESDLDVLIDFPTSRIPDAWRFTEEICAKHAIPADIHDASTTSAKFLGRVRARGISLP